MYGWCTGLDHIPISAHHVEHSPGGTRLTEEFYHLSGTSGGDCVEVAVNLRAAYAHASKTAGHGPMLRVGQSE